MVVVVVVVFGVIVVVMKQNFLMSNDLPEYAAE